jgi:hypothetical protein
LNVSFEFELLWLKNERNYILKHCKRTFDAAAPFFPATGPFTPDASLRLTGSFPVFLPEFAASSSSYSISTSTSSLLAEKEELKWFFEAYLDSEIFESDR